MTKNAEERALIVASALARVFSGLKSREVRGLESRAGIVRKFTAEELKNLQQKKVLYG